LLRFGKTLIDLSRKGALKGMSPATQVKFERIYYIAEIGREPTYLAGNPKFLKALQNEMVGKTNEEIERELGVTIEVNKTVLKGFVMGDKP